MFIKKRRIYKLEKYLDEKNLTKIKSIGIKIKSENKNKVIECGFSEKILLGEEVIPNVIGPITNYNVNGKEIIDKNQKENRDIFRPYHIKDWHGEYHDGIAHEVRECNKKNILNPYEIALKIVSIKNEKYVISKEGCYDKDKIKHIINMFLEIFKECEIIYENDDINYGNIIELNWKILPKGEYPWEKIYPYVKKRIEKMPETKARLIKNNIETISKYNPKFVAVGQAGFSGYIIYGFKKENKVILESIEIDNATYILNKDWKNISKLTKSEILKQKLHEKRIVHSKSWEKEITNEIKDMI